MNETNAAALSAPASREPSQEEISRRARELWEKYGRPAGRDEDIWLEAERSLQAAPAPTVTPRPAHSASAAAAMPKTTSVRPPRSAVKA